MIEAPDSYYEHVVGRMQTINPNRQMLGIMSAMDWPAKTVRFESFYLLVLGPAPLGKQAFSPSIPVVSHILQWVWMVYGTDIQQGNVGRNRGDRYRTNMTMQRELLKAHFPLFCEKQTWSTTGASATGISLKSASFNPPESVWWSPLTFMPKPDKESGVVYGAASFELVEMTEAITA